MKQEVKVKGMSCAGCANTVEKRFSGLPNVESVEVDLENNQATLESSKRISDEVLKESLEGTNYSVVK